MLTCLRWSARLLMWVVTSPARRPTGPRRAASPARAPPRGGERRPRPRSSRAPRTARPSPPRASAARASASRPAREQARPRGLRVHGLLGRGCSGAPWHATGPGVVGLLGTQALPGCCARLAAPAGTLAARRRLPSRPACPGLPGLVWWLPYGAHPPAPIGPAGPWAGCAERGCAGVPAHRYRARPGGAAARTLYSIMGS